MRTKREGKPPMSMPNPNPKNEWGKLPLEDFKTTRVVLRLSEKDKLRMATKAKEKSLTLSEFLRLSGLKESKPKKVKDN